MGLAEAEEGRTSGLSFATHLYGQLDSVKKKSQRTQADCGDVARAMRDLATVEEAYAKGLKRVAAAVGKVGGNSSSTAREALDAFRSNLKHAGDLHGSLAHSISTDVEDPLLEARDAAKAASAAAVSPRLLGRGPRQRPSRGPW
ncbi:hypothetical protein M885DRAFT_246323 [Pelagophyceae sp. CCMP2097]|nr:hypothetical protein M885DRAFT_246323 [Pelagophyceae sp. CCMP2097]